MGTMAIMGKEGDTKAMWNPENAVEVEAAREQFASLKKKGFAMYRVNLAGDKGELITEFDPKAGKIIAAPPMQGG